MRVRLRAAIEGADVLPSHQRAQPFFSEAVYGLGQNGFYAHSKPRRSGTRASQYDEHPLRHIRLALLHMDVSMWGCLEDHPVGAAVRLALMCQGPEVKACGVPF